ncbi:MAG: hypothetical protein DSZ24_02300 [Thermodesulfatator sp.]|nr:MAG: hypothetical protein DSZ24_02300 [Thermodesulfatator sp.]
MKRRDFLKVSAGASLTLAGLKLRVGGFFRRAYAQTQKPPELPGSLGAKEIPSVCEMCFWRCPIVAKVKGGKVVKIEGNPKSPTNGRGGKARVCARGNSGVKLLYDPDRVLHPLKRVGQRGEGRWVKISWEEALDEVAENLKKVKEKYGPHAIAFFDHGASAKPLREVFKALGTENYSNEPAFFQCVGPVEAACINTLGYVASGTMQYTDMANARAILLVGSHLGENVHVSHVMDFVEGLSRGAKLVVVDPRFSVAAGKADLWLPIRPGTDTALLLSWINYVLEHGLYDREFVSRYCEGLETLKKAVKGWTLERAARLCDLPQDQIEQAIKLLAAARPHVCIHPGRHSAWYGKGDVYRHQALLILEALFGGIGTPGGLCFPTPISLGRVQAVKEAEVEESEEPLKGKYPFCDPFPGSPTHEIIKATLTGQPYPIKAWGICGANLLQTIPNPYQTMEAIRKLDFIFCFEIYPTENALWSDIILPDTVYLERYDDVYVYDSVPQCYVTVRQPAVKPLGEARSPFWLAKELAKRLGLKVFRTESEVEILNERLQGLGLSLEKLNQEGGLVVLPAKAAYDRENFRNVFGEKGLKVKLAIEDFEDEDFSPVPIFEPAPAPPEGYARLIYGRVPVHTFSRTMNNEWLHHEWPENQAWINDEVAAKLGLKDGEEIVLENQDGKRSFPVKVKVTPGIRPDCIYLSHGFGSRSSKLSRAYRKGASDQFLITHYVQDPFMGASSHRTNFVRIVKGGKVLNLPELRPLPPEIPRFKVSSARESRRATRRRKKARKSYPIEGC